MLSLLKALFFTAGPKYSGKKSALVITLSTTVVLSLTAGVCGLRASLKRLQVTEAASTVQAIIQTGEQSCHASGLRFAPLPAGYLSEVLDLSVDCPANLNRFKLDEAKERLLATHIIESVRLKKMKPNLLFIDYALREPWAILEDYTNTGMDSEGFFFPLAPFYSPRNLPRIYLGAHAPPNPWGDQMLTPYLERAFALCAALKNEEIERIDLSHAEDPCAGRREIVLTLKGGIMLRLTPKNCIQQLSHYSILRATFLNREEQPVIIDLRLPEVAYIQKVIPSIINKL